LIDLEWFGSEDSNHHFSCMLGTYIQNWELEEGDNGEMDGMEKEGKGQWDDISGTTRTT